MAATARRVRAACGQFCATNNLSKNLAVCQQLVTEAASIGAKILFLPEASDYISTTPSESISLCQPPSTSPFVLGLQKLARTHSLPILVGIHEPAQTSLRVQNTTIYISETGAITQRYQKVHVFDVDIAGGPKIKESLTTEPGEAITPPFDSPVGKIGMQICFDVRFPEPALVLKRLGAQTITYPSAFMVATGEAHWETLVRARAIETQCFVIAGAQIGWHHEKRASFGASLIVDPWGRVLAKGSQLRLGEKMRDVPPEIVHADLDLEEIEKVRREVPLNRRWDVYPQV